MFIKAQKFYMVMATTCILAMRLNISPQTSLICAKNT